PEIARLAPQPRRSPVPGPDFVGGRACLAGIGGAGVLAPLGSGRRPGGQHLARDGGYGAAGLCGHHPVAECDGGFGRSPGGHHC
ncbi:hypothetical protein ABTE60_21400, partial [Acinetobacter baumannii]